MEELTLYQNIMIALSYQSERADFETPPPHETGHIPTMQFTKDIPKNTLRMSYMLSLTNYRLMDNIASWDTLQQAKLPGYSNRAS